MQMGKCSVTLRVDTERLNGFLDGIGAAAEAAAQEYATKNVYNDPWEDGYNGFLAGAAWMLRRAKDSWAVEATEAQNTDKDRD